MVPAAIRIPAEIGAYAVGPWQVSWACRARRSAARDSVVWRRKARLPAGLRLGLEAISILFRRTGAAAQLAAAALGAAAHGRLTTGANAVLQKTLGKPGTVDPAAAIASTAKDSADAYAKLHQGSC